MDHENMNANTLYD